MNEDTKIYWENQFFNTKVLIRDMFTLEQLKELQIDIEESIVNKD
tara:strand:+ start:92 stop:226 length:135 start_codon:yes stop_codon:yes gene_type:complete